MKRVLLYITLCVISLFAPCKRLDVADLEPVEVVYLCKEGEAFVLLTDTGAKGTGVDAQAALADLHAKTAGVVYLDTAEYLLISDSAKQGLESLRAQMKDDVKLCQAEKVDMESVAQFLKIHGDLPEFKSWDEGDHLPQIIDGRIVNE